MPFTPIVPPLSSAGGTVAGNLTINPGTLTVTGGFVDITTNGGGLKVKEGANSKQGLTPLVAGTVTIANANVTANSRIFLTSNADGGTPGFLRVTAIVAGVSFTITSSNVADTSSVAWEIFEPG